MRTKTVARILAAVAVPLGIVGATLVHAGSSAAATSHSRHAAAHATERSSSLNMYVTLYGWDDNSPPGCDIAYPDIHSCAGGSGTYSNPITYATDQSELAQGTIVYYAPLQRYFIMEDDCTECDEDWTGHGPDGGPGYRHIDLWAGGASGDNANALYACEDKWTSNGQVPVIVNPPSNEPVSSGTIFNASNGSCWKPGSGGGGTSVNMYVTLYGWDDNSPPGCAIAYPKIHSCAGGTGTYSSPITYATDKSELAVGTIVYFAPLKRYFIMEDDCTECDQDWTGQGPDGGPRYRHIDLWAGGANGDDANALYACEDKWTSNGQVPVIV
ncbi:MAG TPA: hypothetical protein VGS21_04920, partial [Acidimicrobiales bacterium]|nr:hypothetical protein [Acidimicrobiales bacterium]